MNGHLVTTKPTCAPCARCGRLKLTGLAEGLPYRADPAPITLRAEAAARLAGRFSYALIAECELIERDATRIAGDARRGRPPVLADHDCQRPVTEVDIDTKHLEAVARLIKVATPADGRPAPKPITDTETEALFTINRHLGGRVVAIVDTPPY